MGFSHGYDAYGLWPIKPSATFERSVVASATVARLSESALWLFENGLATLEELDSSECEFETITGTTIPSGLSRRFATKWGKLPAAIVGKEKGSGLFSFEVACVGMTMNSRRAMTA